MPSISGVEPEKFRGYTIGVMGIFLHVSEAKYLHDYVIWLKFTDSAEGEGEIEKKGLREERRVHSYIPFPHLPFLQFFHLPLQTVLKWTTGRATLIH